MENYEIIQPIGSGSFGQVYLAIHRTEQRQYVMKKVALMATMDVSKRQATELEVKLLSELRHPNIVAFKDSFTDNEGCLCILMEYCEHGDIGAFITEAKKTRGMPDEHKLMEWFIQVALALHALHLKKILHRDLKTQNIFLTGDRQRDMYALKLGDFGIAKVLDSTTDLAKTQIGTPFYMSPELINNKSYSYKSDVWGLGCVLYEIVNGQRAFDAQSLNGLALKIIKGNYTPITTTCSTGTKSLIKSMLSKNPNHRPTIKEILYMTAIRNQIPQTLQTVIVASSNETRIATERALVEQLTTLGLGALVNCPGPTRDRRSLQHRLEKAELRKRREEEMLQKTAALLEKCLKSSQHHGKRSRRSKSPPRHVSLAPPLDNGMHQQAGPIPEMESQRPAPWEPEPPAQHWQDSQRPAPWEPEPDQHNSQEETPRQQEATLLPPPSYRSSKGDGWRQDIVPVRPRARTEDAPGPPPGPPPAPTSQNASAVSWLLEYDHIKKENLANPFSNVRNRVVHSPGAPHSNRRYQSKNDRVPSPPPLQYGEPPTPNQAPPNNMRTSWRTADADHGPPPPPRPQRSVRLEALNPDSRSQPQSEESDTSDSLSEVEDGFSDGVSSYSQWDGDEIAKRRSVALQQRIDQSRAAIYRHRMKIEMLQYTTMEQNEMDATRGSDAFAGGGGHGPGGAHGTARSHGTEVGGISRRGFGAIVTGPAPPVVQDSLARLARRCFEGLGNEKFQAARRCLQACLDASEVPSTVRSRMFDLLGMDKIGFYSLIDQIVHMERRWGVMEGPT